MRLARVVAVGACAVLLFGYGFATAQYRIFPYRFLVKARALLPSSLDKPWGTARYYDRLSLFDSLGGHEFDVVFVGDSITASAEWQEMFPGLKVANRGIGSEMTGGTLERIGSICSTSAAKAFVMIGVNDINAQYPVDDIFGRYATLVDRLRDCGMKVYIQSTLFVGTQRASAGVNERIALLDRKLQALARQGEIATYVDLNPVLAPTGELDSRYTSDGMHLNGRGYVLWKAAIEAYLR